MDEIRIKLLEFIGWTDLTRQRKFGVGAIKGTSPEGNKDQYAPNPCMSLDSMFLVESFAKSQRKYDQLFWRYSRLLVERYFTQYVKAEWKAKVFAQALAEYEQK